MDVYAQAADASAARAIHEGAPANHHGLAQTRRGKGREPAAQPSRAGSRAPDRDHREIQVHATLARLSQSLRHRGRGKACVAMAPLLTQTFSFNRMSLSIQARAASGVNRGEDACMEISMNRRDARRELSRSKCLPR